MACLLGALFAFPRMQATGCRTNTKRTVHVLSSTLKSRVLAKKIPSSFEVLYIWSLDRLQRGDLTDVFSCRCCS